MSNMFVRLVVWVCLLGASASLGAAAAQSRPAPFGVWLTENGESHIEIFPCGEVACGRVAWMKDDRDDSGKPLTDINNPNPAMHSVPVLGLVIMTGIEPIEEEKRFAGKVYNPRNGKTYDVELIVESESEIIIEGCGLYGLVCQQQEWQRAGP